MTCAHRRVSSATKVAKRPGGEGKIDDELPVPHHSGYVVSAAADRDLVFDHQKLQS
jgi:hypothetical protein